MADPCESVDIASDAEELEPLRGAERLSELEPLSAVRGLGDPSDSFAPGERWRSAIPK
jgi:hypothetical protein